MDETELNILDAEILEIEQKIALNFTEKYTLDMNFHRIESEIKLHTDIKNNINKKGKNLTRERLLGILSYVIISLMMILIFALIGFFPINLIVISSSNILGAIITIPVYSYLVENKKKKNRKEIAAVAKKINLLDFEINENQNSYEESIILLKNLQEELRDKKKIIETNNHNNLTNPKNQLEEQRINNTTGGKTRNRK